MRRGCTLLLLLLLLWKNISIGSVLVVEDVDIICSLLAFYIFLKIET